MPSDSPVTKVLLCVLLRKSTRTEITPQLAFGLACLSHDLLLLVRLKF